MSDTARVVMHIIGKELSRIRDMHMLDMAESLDGANGNWNDLVYIKDRFPEFIESIRPLIMEKVSESFPST